MKTVFRSPRHSGTRLPARRAASFLPVSGRVGLPIVVCLLFGMLCTAAAADEASEPTGVLTLPGGDAVRGRFQPAEQSGLIRWQGTEFTRPFEFPVETLAAIRFPPAQPPIEPVGEFVIELHGGDMLSGRLAGWSEESVTVESSHFGTVTVKPEAVRRLYRIAENPTLVYTGPHGMDNNWQTRGPAWKEDGAHLWTDQDQTSLTRDVGLPDQAVIEFEISWKSDPRFVFTVGVDPMSWPDTRRDGWRFEVWRNPKRAAMSGQVPAGTRRIGGEGRRLGGGGMGLFSVRAEQPAEKEEIESVLAIVRELSDVGTSALVERFSRETKRIHLVAYLDQTARTMQVFHPDGQPAAEVRLPESESKPNDPKGKPGRGVRIVNRYGDVRLERLRILRWNGQLPTPLEPGESRFELADGEVVSGEIVRFDADPRRFTVRQEGREVTVNIEELVTVTQPSEWESPGAEVSDEQAERETNRENGQPEQNESGGGGEAAPVSVVLQDGTRISGRLEAVREDALLVHSPDIAQVLPLNQADLRAVSFRTATASSESAAREVPHGRLELGEHRLAGRLIAGSERPEASCLVWHPRGSLTGSPLRPDASGRIVYQERSRSESGSSPSSGRSQNQTRQLGRNFGEIFLKKAENPIRPSGASVSSTIHLRSGDAIPCSVLAIDEEGVHISSPVAESQLIPHELIKAAELLPRASPPDLEAAKKERLLTVPRLQKASPPTHLLCARNGDLLRCRLIGLDDRTVRIELHLAEIELPRDRITQIIWFHPDELNTTAGKDESGAEPVEDSPQPFLPTSLDGLVQVIQSDGNRVTFHPEEVDGESIAGTSEVLGACRFNLEAIDQLLFGKRIETEAAELAYHRWRLQPAVEPLVAQGFEGTGSGAGTVSPLVGQPAPEIDLALLDGGQFRLSECRGQIVVLDFWASWCGPCMQTMPLMEQAMQEFDPNEVRMVSVNLEEPAEEIEAVLERHKLGVTVALDIDGVAAARYEANAIPQLVIVDREGTVARLYVGGGRNVVEQLKLAINELLSSE
jgi:thiol-disulfide isomerase/thioredoxin